METISGRHGYILWIYLEKYDGDGVQSFFYNFLSLGREAWGPVAWTNLTI